MIRAELRKIADDVLFGVGVRNLVHDTMDGSVFEDSCDVAFERGMNIMRSGSAGEQR